METCLWNIILDLKTLIERHASQDPNHRRYDPNVPCGLICHPVLSRNPYSLEKDVWLSYHASSIFYMSSWLIFQTFSRSFSIDRSTGPYVLIHCGLNISLCFMWFMSCLQSCENPNSCVKVDFDQQVDQNQSSIS